MALARQLLYLVLHFGGSDTPLNMKRTLLLGFAVILLTAASFSTVIGQSTKLTAVNAPNGEASQTDLLREVQLLRQAVEQLRKELIQLEVATIQIRLQQEVVAGKEARLDSVRSEIQFTEDAIAQLRERIGKFDGADVGTQNEIDQAAKSFELENAKKELDRQTQKLELLKSKDLQLTQELMGERTRLTELLARMEAMGSDISARHSNN